MTHPKLPWLTIIALPFIIELIISITILLIWLLIPGYIILFKGSSINNIELTVFIYFACSWLYAVWMFFKNSTSIPKSLLIFPLFIKDISWKDRNNRILSLTSIAAFIIIWQLFNKPEIQLNKFEIIENRLDSVVEVVNSTVKKSKRLEENITNIKNAKNSINEFDNFSKVPEQNQLPQTKDGIEKLSKEYQSFLSDFKYYKANIKEKVSSIDRSENELTNNTKLLDSIEKEINNLCVIDDISKKPPACSSLTEKIQQIKISINSVSQLLITHKQNLQSKNESINIPDQVLARWETKIQEIYGKYYFDISRVKDWLDTADSSSNRSEKEILINTEDYKQLATKNYAEIIDNITREINELNKEVTQLEQQSERLVEAKLLLEKVSNNDSSLYNINQKNNRLKIEIQSIQPQIQERLNQLDYEYNWLKQISGGGYTLSVSARNNTEGKIYINTILNKKRVIDNLIKEISDFKSGIEKLNNKLESERNQWQWNLDRNISLAQSLKYRTKKLKRKLEWVIIRGIISKAVLAFVIIGTLLVIGISQYRMRRITKFKQLGTNLPELMRTIENPNEFLSVRTKAIDILEKQNLFKEDINKIKDVIKKIEKSKSENDSEVASELRKVASSLELRLTEER